MNELNFNCINARKMVLESSLALLHIDNSGSRKNLALFRASLHQLSVHCTVRYVCVRACVFLKVLTIG